MAASGPDRTASPTCSAAGARMYENLDASSPGPDIANTASPHWSRVACFQACTAGCFHNRGHVHARGEKQSHIDSVAMAQSILHDSHDAPAGCCSSAMRADRFGSYSRRCTCAASPLQLPLKVHNAIQPLRATATVPGRHPARSIRSMTLSARKSAVGMALDKILITHWKPVQPVNAIRGAHVPVLLRPPDFAAPSVSCLNGGPFHKPSRLVMIRPRNAVRCAIMLIQHDEHHALANAAVLHNCKAAVDGVRTCCCGPVCLQPCRFRRAAASPGSLKSLCCITKS